MAKRKILIGEFRCAVDCSTSSSISVNEVASLDHEIFDLEIAISTHSITHPPTLHLRGVPSTVPQMWDIVQGVVDPSKGGGTYHTVKLATLVTLRQTLRGFGLAGTELAEIFCGFGGYVFEEFYFNSSEWFAFSRVLVLV